MIRIPWAISIIISLLIIKLLNPSDCYVLTIKKFYDKGNYCVMFTKEGRIIVDKRCYYGTWKVCGKVEGNVIFPYLSILLG